jgi:integrase
MATINFLIQSTKGDLVPIYIRFRNGRQYDLKVKTKIFIDPSEWSAKKQAPLKPQKSDELVSVVQQMNQMRTNLMDYFHNSIKQGFSIDGEWLRRFVEKGTSNPNDLPVDLIGYFEYYLNIKGSEIKKTTHKKITTFKRFLKNFESWTGKHYMLTEINHDFRIKLEEYGVKMKYATRYISDVLNYVKVICRHGDRNGININRQFEEFKIKRVKNDYITLNFEELEKIEKVELTSDYLNNARDWLLISCETAQRVSDFQSFHKGLIREHIHKNGDILSILQFTQDKTEKEMSILLTKRVLKILEKRNGNFPRAISDVNYNQYIKKVCFKAGLTEIVEGSKVHVDPKTKIKRKVKGLYPKFELVTSHIGRRSFVTNNRNTMPDNLIMNNTGHSSVRMLGDYDHKGNLQTAIDQYNFLNK